jgi:hypothetical protein
MLSRRGLPRILCCRYSKAASPDWRETVKSCGKCAKIGRHRTGRSEGQTCPGQAESKKINAEADDNVITTVDNADASKPLAVGTSEADVLKLKIDSMESSNYALVQVAQALSR